MTDVNSLLKDTIIHGTKDLEEFFNEHNGMYFDFNKRFSARAGSWNSKRSILIEIGMQQNLNLNFLDLISFSKGSHLQISNMFIDLKNYITRRRVKIQWSSKTAEEFTPLHIAAHFASDENRDFLICSYLKTFPELLHHVNNPKTIFHHIAIWAILNTKSKELENMMKTLALLRSLDVKMIYSSSESHRITTRLVQQANNEQGILQNIRQIPAAENDLVIALFQPPKKRAKKKIGSKGGPRVQMSNNIFFNFDDENVKTSLKKRSKTIPSNILKKSGKIAFSVGNSNRLFNEPVDGLELAIIVASEESIVPDTNLVFKEYYIGEILSRNIHKTMKDKITATHIAMLAIQGEIKK